ncbi:MAG: iron-containing alcohol dehydrogenase [Desulfobacterales bacterium]|nr:iron-containing alcohol dehydrogenase [Desulfobacterales bacterium]
MQVPEFYEFHCPVKTNAGINALDHIPIELEAMDARKPLIITDKNTYSKGIIKHVASAFSESGIVLGVFDGVGDTADISTIRDLYQRWQYKGIDSIIAVGSGAVLDTAKGLNIAVSGKPEDLRKNAESIKTRLKPLVAVLTGYSNGFEISKYAFIGELTFTSPFLMPDLVVVDPRMVRSESALRIAETAMITFSHAAEAITHASKNPLSDCYAYAALEYIRHCLMEALKNPKDKKSCLALAEASSMAGCAFSNSRFGMVHELGQEIAKQRLLSSGQAMGILLPYGIEYQTLKCGFQAADMLIPLVGFNDFVDTPQNQRNQKVLSLIRQMQDNICSTVQLPRTFKDVQIEKEKLKKVAQKVAESSSSGIREDAYLTVLNAAYDGKPIMG